MKPIIVMFCLFGAANAAVISINDSGPNTINGVTNINCSGVTVNFSESNECCIGGSCADYQDVDLENPTNNCLSLVVDGYKYSVDDNLQIIHSAKMIQGNTSMRSCRQPNGQYPNTAGFNALNIASNDVFFGVAEMALDVAKWQMVIKSLDGNLLCEGGESVDIIFMNGFED